MSAAVTTPAPSKISSLRQLHEKIDSLFTREYRKDFPYRLDILEGQAGQMKRMLYHDANPEAAKIDDRIGMCADLVIQLCMLTRSAGLSVSEAFHKGASILKGPNWELPLASGLDAMDPFEFIDSSSVQLLEDVKAKIPMWWTLRLDEPTEFRLAVSREMCKSIGNIGWVNPSLTPELGLSMAYAFIIVKSLGFTSREVFEHGFARVDQKVYAHIPRLRRAEVSDEVKKQVPGFITAGLSAIPGRAEGVLKLYYKGCPDAPTDEKIVLLAEKDDVTRTLQTYVMHNADHIAGIIICTSAMNTHTVISVRDHHDLHIPIIVQVPEGDFVKLCARANKRVSMTVTKDLSFVAEI